MRSNFAHASMEAVLRIFRINEDKMTFVLGIVVLILSAYVIGGYIKSINKTASSDNISATSTEVQDGAYTIEAGDSLWKIAEDAYGDGYAWTKIYDQNKETIGNNPSMLVKGMKITLPKLEPEKPVEYTVEKGDTMWDISVQFCGDGFQWQQIATNNEIPNPRLIEPGLKLKVLCRRL